MHVSRTASFVVVAINYNYKNLRRALCPVVNSLSGTTEAPDSALCGTRRQGKQASPAGVSRRDQFST